uniref:Helicase ATP-binding domain-containing protein n=1 Tax=Amphimedon queenslandica TaxID=400682 RepID=A0A1X7V1H5_AMPQE
MAVYAALINVIPKLGYDSLRSLQVKVITSLVTGIDIFAVLPMGYGKSLCYLVLPLLHDILGSAEDDHSIIVVVNPLKALLEDQVCSSSKRRVKSAYICEDTKEDKRMKEGVLKGDYQIVYFTPESLLGSKKLRVML